MCVIKPFLNNEGISCYAKFSVLALSLVNEAMRIDLNHLIFIVAERIQTHLPGSETLYKYIPRDILPKEYGGHSGPINSLRSHWLEYLESNR